MYGLILTLSLFGSNTTEDWPPPVIVDIVEWNTVYQFTQEWWQNKPILTKGLEQTIGWKIDPDGILHADWWVVGHIKPINYKDGYYIFYINDAPYTVKVLARQIIQRNTFGDPEVENRDVYPGCCRAGLHPWKRIKEHPHTTHSW
ncbi:MAG: hypothetical protein KatS3mg087_2078 [Patescibacteria group bacterium]|nr:MAG: hypothetical protein KatS3mg087_2078 [Patescibacteria group bacterium]